MFYIAYYGNIFFKYDTIYIIYMVIQKLIISLLSNWTSKHIQESILHECIQLGSWLISGKKSGFVDSYCC